MFNRTYLERKVREFVADAADLPLERVGLEDNLYTDLGIDSLASIAIFVELMSEFGVPEPGSDSEYAELDTAKKLVNYVMENAS
jgi:acyl carrier protein